MGKDYKEKRERMIGKKEGKGRRGALDAKIFGLCVF
jgi:hypothetical protein